MYPHERSLVKRLADKPFVLVGVNSDTDKEELKKAMAKENITWRSFFDGSTSGPIASRWEIEGWPTLYLIDHKGVLRKKYLGSPGDQVLDKEIEALIKEAEKAEGKTETSK
jgi:hypothetical protein